MVSSIIASIAADASPQEQVDWLELTAFFDTFKRARLDEIAGGLHLQADGDDEDIAAEDAERDRLREDIEAEVQERSPQESPHFWPQLPGSCLPTITAQSTHRLR